MHSEYKVYKKKSVSVWLVLSCGYGSVLCYIDHRTVSSVSGGSYWDQGQGRPGGNWNSKSSGSWANDQSSASGWGQSQPNPGGSHWADGPSNQWQSGTNRKPSFAWDETQMNGGAGDYGRNPRPMVSVASHSGSYI